MRKIIKIARPLTKIGVVRGYNAQWAKNPLKNGILLGKPRTTQRLKSTFFKKNFEWSVVFSYTYLIFIPLFFNF